MSSGLEQLRRQALSDPETPEPVRRALAGGATLEEIRLDARGRWWHQGEPFVNERLARLFSQSLVQTEAGLWLLQIGGQSYPVEVEETGAFCERFDVGADRVTLRLTSGEEVAVGLAGWMTDGESRIGIRLSDGRDVRLTGQAHQAALALAAEVEGGWVISFPLGGAPLAAWPARPSGLRPPSAAAQG